MNPVAACIGETYDDCAAKLRGRGFKEDKSPRKPPLDMKKLGMADVRVPPPSLDRVPTCYVFEKDGLTVSIMPLPIAVAKVEVYFRASIPSEAVEVLLEQYSGVPNWTVRTLPDRSFRDHFPYFNERDRSNSFYAAKGVVALVQKGVIMGKLVLWIQTDDYHSQFRDYRDKRKKAAPNVK